MTNLTGNELAYVRPNKVASSARPPSRSSSFYAMTSGQHAEPPPAKRRGPNVGGGDDAVQQQALRIDQNMPLLALDQLAGIEAVAVDASLPFSALFTLYLSDHFTNQTVDDAGRGAGFARGFLAALEVERMMDAIQRAVPVPQAEVIMHGASIDQAANPWAARATGSRCSECTSRR